MSRKKINEIKLLTGISIFLVVAGHLASRGAVDIPLYVAFKKMIYKFHMPLFIFLSGFIAFYSYTPIESKKNYFEFMQKKTIRLLPAYLILSLIFIIGKFLVSNSINFIQSFLDILFFPSNSAASFLWYIYVLYMYYLILPLIFSFKNKLIILLPFCLFISFFDFTKFMALQSFFWYLPFFIYGGIVSLNYNSFNKISKKFGLLSLLIFIAWSILEFNYVINIPKQIVAIFSIIGLHYFVKFVLKNNSIIEILGENTFYIYLFNSLFIGALNVFLIGFLGKDLYYDLFYYLAPILVLAGVILPILLHKFIISKLPFIKYWIK